MMARVMRDLWDVELQIALAEGVVSRDEAEALGEEARRTQRRPLALLVERGRLSDESFRSMFAQALNGSTLRGQVSDGSASTAATATPEDAAGEPAFPIRGWDRYLNVRFLGQGGMGKVFLAIDPRLRREVAIKFVRGDDADHVRRLISEARTQAQVSHEHVCRIYEAGEVDGKVFIAMQYIAGRSLGSLAGELTLEQKVALVRGAAEGIHAAHTSGIIHRDIKPSNILVERGDDGAIRPYVMDFGLARSAQDAGTTLTGAILGTPRYMAPEQAHGEPAKLDRRADVYSLGATLYHLLAGQPPVPGSSPTEVIHNLVTLEPRPLRAIDAGIPIDLESIVLACLEKDRSARYDSARALADDLGRFLNGEPVLARRAGRWYRLRKRMAKHRRLVAASAVAFMLVVVATGWAIWTRLAAAEQARLTRRFTERVERIDAMARYAALSPLHDIQRDQRAIRAAMGSLADEIQQAGAIAAGPGHYALGRGYLALGDEASAREQLESAWQAGDREPRVAYQLALVMGHLFRQKLVEAERIANPARRDAARRAIEAGYRDPALAYLASSAGAEVPSAAYVAALVAFYEGRFDAALAQLDAIGSGLPWFYEAPELRGDILLARALRLRNEGQRERAARDFDAARTAYVAAAAVGESVPAVYTSLAELEYTEMVTELYGNGEVMPPFERALAATRKALTAAPDHYEALVLAAHARRSLAEHQAQQGVDVADLLGKALADAQHAVAVAPARPEARLEMAQIYRQWGDARNARKQDPSEQLAKALEASEHILAHDRDANYHGNLGLLYSIWADYQDRTGVDSEANRGKAIEAFERALQINSKLNDVWTNLGINAFNRAAQPRARDPDRDLSQAIAALDQARSLNPDHVVADFYQGKAYQLMAQRTRTRGGDPGPALERSLQAYDQGLSLNSRRAYLHNGRGAVLMDLAKHAWDDGKAPDPSLDEARKAFEQAIAVAPEHPYGYGNVGEVHAQRAWFQRARGDDPMASVQAAVDALNQAIAKGRSEAVFWSDLALARVVQAGYALDHGGDPGPGLQDAARAITEALDRDPGDAQAHLLRAEMLAICARLQAQQGLGRNADFAAAAAAFEEATRLAPANPDYQVAFGQFYRAWAELGPSADRDAARALDRGLELARQLLRSHPAWPDALALHASLTLLEAERLADPGERRTRAALADQEFARLRTLHPALARAWASQAARAAKLSGGS